MPIAFPFELTPGDDAKLQAYLAEFGKAYLAFVDEQLSKHINPDGPYIVNAKLIVIAHTAALVATSITSAVWSAEQAAKLDKAGNN